MFKLVSRAGSGTVVGYFAGIDGDWKLGSFRIQMCVDGWEERIKRSKSRGAEKMCGKLRGQARHEAGQGSYELAGCHKGASNNHGWPIHCTMAASAVVPQEVHVRCSCPRRSAGATRAEAPVTSSGERQRGRPVYPLQRPLRVRQSAFAGTGGLKA